MKEQDRIYLLLEEYYLGKTSSREEEEIRDFFRKGNIPEDLFGDAELFGFFSSEKSASVNQQLENKILSGITASRNITENVFSRLRYYWISGAAAVIIVLLAIFVDVKLIKDDTFIVKEDTFEDPYIAYAEAKRVIYFVSAKMNTGTESLRNLEKLDEGTDFIQPVFSFAPGFQKLEYLNTIDRTKDLLSK